MKISVCVFNSNVMHKCQFQWMNKCLMSVNSLASAIIKKSVKDSCIHENETWRPQYVTGYGSKVAHLLHSFFFIGFCFVKCSLTLDIQKTKLDKFMSVCNWWIRKSLLNFCILNWLDNHQRFFNRFILNTVLLVIWCFFAVTSKQSVVYN